MLTERLHKVTEQAPPAAEARLGQLQRILESRTFRSTEVLKRLLDYLVRKELLGESEELKEYTVGVEAFAKPPDYDPKTDSSVRVQAGKLRQKLDEYYRTEGGDDPLIVELPKGHFRLSFRERTREAGEAAVPAAGISRRLVWLVIGGIVLALTAGYAGWRLGQNRSTLPRFTSAEVRELWRPFLDDPRPAVVSLGAPLFAKVQGTFFRDPVMNSWDKAQDSNGVKELEQALGGKAVPQNPYTGVGEASAAFELARLFLSQNKDLNLAVSSGLTWEDIGRNNVIFVGPPKYNLQTRDLPVEMDFAVEHSRVVNRHPRPGEPPSYNETWSADRAVLQEGHALISRLPGLHGTGYIMMLASTSTEGTRAAVEYVTRPDYAARLVRSLRGKDGVLPKYFQVVVRAQFKSQVPIHVEQVTAHVLGN
jgi:hypothetical protein